MRIFVKVKPAAKEEKVEKIDDTNFKVEVKEPPREGKANAAVTKALASYFDVTQSDVRIVSGFTSRSKIIEVDLTGN